jgi:RecJ-like exonuclease
MNPIKIECPACSARGKIKAINARCPYCNGKKHVKLTYHLKRIGHLQELRNVEDFQRRTLINTEA